jgi:hypothetical protein
MNQLLPFFFTFPLSLSLSLSTIVVEHPWLRVFLVNPKQCVVNIHCLKISKEETFLFGCGRSRRRWEDNIKMDLQEVGCEGVDWIELARDRDRWRALVNAVMNLRVQ